MERKTEQLRLGRDQEFVEEVAPVIFEQDRQ